MAAQTPHAAWRRAVGVVDAHAHLRPEYLDVAIRIMDANGIQMMIDMNPFGPELFWELQSAIRRYPGRFAACTTVNWAGFGEKGWIERECDQLARAVEAGALGLKLHKALGLTVRDTAGRLIQVDDERLAPLFEQAARLGVVIAIHIGDPKAFFRPLNSENERWEELGANPDWWFGDRSKYPFDWWRLIRQLEKVVRRHPQTTIIGAHFGCAAEEIGYVADVMRDCPNYIVDVAARLGELGRHEAAYVREIFEELQDRILFGTDISIAERIDLGAPQAFVPVAEDIERFYNAHWLYFETDRRQIAHPTPIQGNWRIDAVNLPKETLEKLYYKNAYRYLLHR